MKKIVYTVMVCHWTRGAHGLGMAIPTQMKSTVLATATLNASKLATGLPANMTAEVWASVAHDMVLPVFPGKLPV